MHPNPSFRQAARDQNIAAAQARGFGTLAVNASPSPLLSHVPFVLSDDGAVLEAHLVRSNPILAELPSNAVISVLGPDGYISPDWYGVADQVPTWNYTAVHIRGRLIRTPQDSLGDVLDRLSAEFEGRLNKAPWTMAKMTADARDRMMRMIVPIRMEVSAIDGTWKLGQNKAASARLGAADEVETGVGAELTTLADLMRDPPA